MKRLVRIYRRWRYRRLYNRLFLLYADKSTSADQAGYEAAEAFEWHTGLKWTDVVCRAVTAWGNDGGVAVYNVSPDSAHVGS